jgi:hypothetical protein
MYPKITSQIQGEFASTVKIETSENVFEIVEVDTSSTKMFGIVTPSAMTLEAYDLSGLADSFPDIALASLFENLGANFSALSTNLS